MRGAPGIGWQNWHRHLLGIKFRFVMGILAPLQTLSDFSTARLEKRTASRQDRLLVFLIQERMNTANVSDLKSITAISSKHQM